MATEEYSVGYDAGYQAGWNEAMDAQTKPPQRTWVGLTDEEKSLDGAPVNYGIEEAWAWVSGAEWAEAKLNGKNNA